MKKAVVVLGLLACSPFNAWSVAPPPMTVAAAEQADPILASAVELPTANALFNDAIESDLEFDAFVLDRLTGHADYQALETSLKQARLRVEVEDAEDSAVIYAGAKLRPQGDQNTSVEDLGGYINLQKTLYDFGRVSHRVASAQSEVEASHFENQQKAAELKAELTERYLEILKNEVDLHYFSEQKADLAGVIEHLKARSSGGLGSSLDYELLLDEQETLELEIKARRLEVEKLRQVFANQYGSLPAGRLLPSRLVPELYRQSRWSDTLFVKSPAIRQMDQRIAAARSFKESRESEKYPSLTFSAAYLESDLDYELFTTVDLSYPLYNGGKAELGVAEEELKITELLLQMQSERKRVKDEASALLYDYNHAVKRYAVYDELVQAKTRTIGVMQERLRRTQGQLREIYNVKKGLVDGQIRRDRAYLDAIFYAYRSRLLLGA